MPIEKTSRSGKRQEQQRAADAKNAILGAALADFAEFGFEGASIRGIAKRIGVKHQLISYYFDSKESLWQAVAAHVYDFLKAQRIALDAANGVGHLSAIERLRHEFMAYYHFTVAHPHFHQFMIQKNGRDSNRLSWMVDHFLRPHFTLIKPLIRSAQRTGDLPKGEPVMVYYAIVSLANTLSVMGPDMAAITGLSPEDPKSVRAFAKLFDRIIFSGGFA